MYVIKNGTIHTGTGEVLENYDILIEGKKIKKIEKNICEADAEIIDATGKQVFPGFMIHILLSELWGFRLVTEIMQKLQM